MWTGNGTGGTEGCGAAALREVVQWHRDLSSGPLGQESVAPIGWPVHEKTGLPLTTLCFFPLPLLILSEFEGEET